MLDNMIIMFCCWDGCVPGAGETGSGIGVWWKANLICLVFNNSALLSLFKVIRVMRLYHKFFFFFPKLWSAESHLTAESIWSGVLDNLMCIVMLYEVLLNDTSHELYTPATWQRRSQLFYTDTQGLCLLSSLLTLSYSSGVHLKVSDLSLWSDIKSPIYQM